jgi:hypothetical protein
MNLQMHWAFPALKNNDGGHFPLPPFRNVIMLRPLSLCMAILLLSAQGCVTVHAPEHPIDAVSVYLADYGYHSSLMLPTPDNGYVEYCWGDWSFSVENHDNPYIDGPRALFLSFQSGFGRRYLKVNPITGEPMVPYSSSPLKNLTRFYASRADVEAVEQELNTRYQADEGPPETNPDTGNVYVKDSVHYSFWDNCNDLSADVMRRLGCQVDGVVGANYFHVIQPGDYGSIVPPPAAPAPVQVDANEKKKEIVRGQ